MTIREEILAVIEDKTGISSEEIEDSTRFEKDLGIDSLDIIEIIMEIESKYNIAIDDNHIDGLKTFKDLVDYVIKLI